MDELLVFNRGAKVTLADYALLKRDFPFLKDRSDRAIDRFILNNAAWMSAEHVRQGVESKVMTEGDFDQTRTRMAYRPPLYGRAVVSPVLNDKGEEIGLYDLKGAGSRRPFNRTGGHTNGMASLGEGVREFAREKLISRLFHKVASPHRTVGIYAILDLGFQILDERGPVYQAGLIVRQAHLRTNDSDHATRLDVPFDSKTGLLPAGVVRQGWDQEEILRMFGFSSGFHRQMTTLPGQRETLDIVNVQVDVKGALIDMGTVSYRDFKETIPLWHRSKTPRQAFGPEDLAYPVPEPSLVFPARFARFDLAETFVWPDRIGEPPAGRSRRLSRDSIEDFLKTRFFAEAQRHINSRDVTSVLSPAKPCQNPSRSCKVRSPFVCTSETSSKSVTLAEGASFDSCLKRTVDSSDGWRIERLYNLSLSNGEKCRVSETQLRKQLEESGRPICTVSNSAP